jgi:FOG: PKD repeat
MNNKAIMVQNTCTYFLLPAAMALLLFASATSQAATQFEGKLQEITITDANKTNTPPTPVLQYTLNGNTVMFDAGGSSDKDGSIAKYDWDFGDGTKATGATASHQYASANSYSVTLTVIDNAGGVGITQQQLDLSAQSALFYWSVDKLPQSTPIVSDKGNITITRSSRDATSVRGFQGNCMKQTDNYQYYQIPMAAGPRAKGTIRMYVQHDTTPESMNASNRYFFKSTNDGAAANSLYAYVYKNYIYFYLYDSAGNMHRSYGEGKWKSGVWYLYEFSWDASAGSLVIKRDGTILAQSTATSWANTTPSWTGQNLHFGYIYPIGSLDEIYITN